MSVATASLLIALLALGLGVVNYFHVRDHDRRMYDIERERAQRETSQVWEVRATGPLNWSLDTQKGLIQEMTAEVMNAGRLDSAYVRVRAFIDGDLVGESSAEIIAGGTIAAQVGIPMRGEVPIMGSLVLNLVDSRGMVLATDRTTIAWPTAEA